MAKATSRKVKLAHALMRDHKVIPAGTIVEMTDYELSKNPGIEAGEKDAPAAPEPKGDEK